MIKAALFDVYGTCVDWRSGVATYARGMFADKGFDRTTALRLADLWRAQYEPSMERVRSGERSYVPLDVIQRENMGGVLNALGVAGRMSDSDRDALNEAWNHLPAWTDTVEALTRLKTAMPIATCSNGSVPMMTKLAANAGLPWSMICGADVARDYKRKPGVYLASCAALGTAPDETIMIACHADDLDAAGAAGLMTGYFPRPLENGNGDFTPVEAPERFAFHAETVTSLIDQLIGTT